MEWLSRMNCAIDYMEAHIYEKMDYAKAAQAACCSLPRFQNIFLFVTDITVSEYVRRRRMALAAKDLICGDIKVIDAALKYGYESPEAFTRSFKSFHGISPTDVRKYGKYIDYPRISFEIKITGGHFAMDSTSQMTVYKDILIKMETVELDESLKLAGVTSENLPNFKNITVFHEKFEPVMRGRENPFVEIGISSNISNPGGDYIFGCQVASIDDLPDGLVGIDTGIKKFAALTFRVKPGGDLVGGPDGPGDGMKMAGEYLENEWIPANVDKVYNYRADSGYIRFEIKKEEKAYRMTHIASDWLENSYHIYYFIEVYIKDIENEPEMCFYIPLK